MYFLTKLGAKLIKMAPDLLLIGTGITSALSAAHLQKVLPGANIILWDKARGVGGRMSRCISPTDSSCSADLGAQYITTSTDMMAEHEDIYGPLIRDHVIENLTANVVGMKKYESNARHFVAPQGMSSVVKYFLRSLPEDNIKFNSKVIGIEERSGKFLVTSEDGRSVSVDFVISTIPIPQFLQLPLSPNGLISSEKDLENVAYSSRFVLVLFYDKTVPFPETDWACRYLDHEVFRFVSIDNMKRNRPRDPVAVVFHTSVKFGLENLETTLDEMKEVLLEQVREVFSNWPEPSSARCHRWRFSQIVKPYAGKPGCLIVQQRPSLILGGDAFSESNFDGCIYSASKIVEAVRQGLDETIPC